MRRFNGYRVVDATEILHATLPAYTNRRTNQAVPARDVTLVVTSDNMAVLDPIRIYSDAEHNTATNRVFYPEYVEVPDEQVRH